MAPVIESIHWILLMSSAAATAASGVLFAECAAARGRREDPAEPRAGARPSVAVLIPAHDEERSLGAALDALRPQLREGDRLLVVADNCRDATAEVARRGGAEVARRDEPEHRGKGYALQFGLERLRERPPEVIVVIDADCTAESGSIDALARAAAATCRPAQARYLMGHGGPDRLSAFAFLVRNGVRPLGLHRLGLPCQLMGTGMAFPCSLLGKVRLEPANLVEDLQLGADLACAGHPPLFVPEARVTSALPEAAGAALAQRTRWEHGHLQTLARMGPRLLLAGLRRRQFDLVALAADLFVPPLALLGLFVTALVPASFWAGRAGAGPVPLVLSVLALGLLGAAIGLAWHRHARALIPARALLGAPLYVARKLPIYARYLARRQREWVRTER